MLAVFLPITLLFLAASHLVASGSRLDTSVKIGTSPPPYGARAHMACASAGPGTVCPITRADLRTTSEVPMHLHRITTVALICLPLVLPTPVAAQKHLISQAALISIVENHKGAVLRYIEAAPDSMLGFRPTRGVRTFAEQIEHAAGSDAFIAHMAITGSAKGIPAMGDSAVYLHNKAALKTYAAAAMDHTIAMLRGVSDAAMDENIVQFGNKVTRGRALMELLDHFPWTLGQTVPYLRLNGVTPPEYSPF